MSIAVRIGLASALLVFISITVLVVLQNFQLDDALRPASTDDLERHLGLVGFALDEHVADARATTVALRAMPAIRALADTGSEPQSYAAIVDAATTTLLATARHRPDVLQLRFIDAAGREVIRVDRAERAGPVHVVEGDDLQDKGDRPYFTEAMARPPGEVYVSPIELNRERGAIEVPHRPTLRIATPLDTAEGRVGVVVLNLDLTNVFEQVRAAANHRRLYVVDARGDFLLHPDATQTFASELGTDRRIPTVLSALAPILTDPSPRTFETEDLVFASRPWSTGAEHLVLLEAIPTAEMLAPARSARVVALGVGVVTLALGVLLSGLVARTLTQPVAQLTEAVTTFARESGDASGTTYDHANEVVALSAAFEDMQRALRDRARRLTRQTEQARLIVERAPYGKLVITSDGTIVMANRAAAAMFGHPRDALVGRPLSLVIEDAPDPEQTPEVTPARCVGRHRDGHTIPLEIVATPLEAGDDWHTMITTVDLTERERVAGWFARIVEAMATPTVIVDREGKIGLVNQALEKLLDYEREALLGEPVHMLVPAVARATHAAHVAQFSAAPAARPMGAGRDLFAVRRDGREVPVEIGLTPVEGPTGPAIIASITDLRERVQREAELSRSNAELEQFAYVASHDLQEPLRMVANYTELLARRYEGQLDERADKYIHYASDGARRMQRLISALLMFSRVGSRAGPFADTETAHVVKGAIHALGQAIREARAEVLVSDLPAIHGDADQISLLFQNLVGNALKFHEGPTPRVEIDATDDGAFWRFAVVDHGIGIDPEYADRIFLMFQRLHPVGTYDGSGIGLSIAKRIVDRHGGRIWFEPTPGGGTTFFVTLPKAVNT